MEQKNNLGMIAMIIGIVSVALSVFGDAISVTGIVALILIFVALAAGIAAIVLSVKARKAPATSRGMANAGLITGIIGTVFAGISAICVISCVICVTSAVGTLAADGTLDSALNELSNAIQ